MIIENISKNSSPFFPEEVILVYGSLRTGGIETLIVRMSNYLVSVGIRVSIFCNPGGTLESALDERVNIVAYRETVDLINISNTFKIKKKTGSVVLIISFDPISAARAVMVELALLEKNLHVTHVSGVFHPRAYFMTGERKFRVFLNYLLARAIGKKRIFFMNEECRATHSLRWGADLSQCPILALPINKAEATWQPSDKAMVRIISVGRLVDFKAYNLGAASVVRQCVDRGVRVTWDIFGDGPLLDSIKAEIEVTGAANYVQLMGVLDYNNFQDTVSCYDLFIGMGTAALEAAMAGVPTICATVDECTRCYGYVHSLPHGNVGELQLEPPTMELTDLIQSYFMSTQTQRASLSKKSRSAAENYGMPRFAEALARMATTNEATPPKIAKRIISELYRFASEGFLVKAVRQILSKKKTLHG